VLAAGFAKRHDHLGVALVAAIGQHGPAREGAVDAGVTVGGAVACGCRAGACPTR
jgi:hypothetical protein